MVPCHSEDGPCHSEDGPLPLRGWSPATQRMVPCCSEDGPPVVLRMVPCYSEDGPLILRGWSPNTQKMAPAVQRMVPCHSEDGPFLLRGTNGPQDGPLVSSHVRPASSVIMLLLSDVLVHCTDCSRNIKAGDYEGHECVSTFTPEEEKQAAGLLKRAISTSHEKANIRTHGSGSYVGLA